MCGSTKDRCRTPTTSMVRCDRGARGLIPDYPVLLPVTHQPFIIHHCFFDFSKRTKQILAVKISLIDSNKLITPLDFQTPSSICFIYLFIFSFFIFCSYNDLFYIIIIIIFSFIYGVLALFFVGLTWERKRCCFSFVFEW